MIYVYIIYMQIILYLLMIYVYIISYYIIVYLYDSICLLLSVAHKFPLPRFFQIIFFGGAGVSSCFSRHFQQSFSPSLLGASPPPTAYRIHQLWPTFKLSIHEAFLPVAATAEMCFPQKSNRNPIEIGVKSYKLGYWAMGSFSQNNCSTESMVVSDCDHMVKSQIQVQQNTPAHCSQGSNPISSILRATERKRQ